MSSNIVAVILVSVICVISVVNPQTPDPDESFCTALPDPGEKTGKDGVCISLNKQLKHCPKLKKYLKSHDKDDWEKLRQSFCTQNIRNGRVCCPVEGEDSYEEDTIRENEPDYKSHRHWDLLSMKTTRCGQTSLQFKIIGGNNAVIGQFPWMARIGYLQQNGEALFSCAGTIINSRYILTAAHCLLAHKEGYQLAPVRVAETDDSINPEKSTADYSLVYYRDYQVESVHMHEDYTGNKTSGNDIALIRLKDEIGNVTDDLYARAICLPFVKEYNLGEELNEIKLARLRDDRKTNKYRPVVAGWGKTSNQNHTGSSILQFLDVPVQPGILCRILYANSSYSNRHICVGGDENKNSCWGDSGGPLMQSAGFSTTMSTGTKVIISRKYQIGIVSYGRTDCAKKGIPVVYTRIRDYLWWILETIRP